MIIITNSSDAYHLLHEGMLSFAQAELQGIRVDLKYCELEKARLTEELDQLEGTFRESKFYKHWEHTMRKVNINSNTQLAKYLYGIKKIKPAHSTTSGKGSTDEEALRQLNIPELDQLLHIRKLKKIRDTYLESFMREQVRGVVRPSFNLHLVKTFRSSSDRPNFQNIPKRDKEAMLITRRALYPRIGNQLMEVDFAGIEVRIAACYHEDPVMLRYILNPTSDLHRDMALQLFKLDSYDKTNPGHKLLRSATKNGFVFPQFYGDYYKNCAINLAVTWGGLSSKRKWDKGTGIAVTEFSTLGDHMIDKGINNLEGFIKHVQDIEFDFWSNRFKVYAKWKKRWWHEYQKLGYFTMLTGFICKGLMGRNNVINYPVQGVAFHCLLWCFTRLTYLFNDLKLQTKLIGQIHDAIVLDIYPPELPLVSDLLRKVMTKELVEHWKWIIVPMEIEADLGGIDMSYADLKPYKL